MKFDIWSEGFLVTGMEGQPAQARRHASGIEADSFQEACDKFFIADKLYNSERLSHWGCGLFDNEQLARRSFG